MEMKLEQKDAADWVYRGEGAANLVLSYTGSSPLFIGKVMRIQKTARNGSSHCLEDHTVLTEHERLLWKESEELVSSSTKELAELHYVKHVMTPLLGPKHVDAGMHVVTSSEFLESIEKKVVCQRPAWRVDAAKVDTKCDFVLLMTDHSLFPNGTAKVGPCISVEIKPKCGFLPLSRFIAEKNAIKRSTTRFRMHQVLKLRQHEISELSQYDPLDIFSGSKERIYKALNDLYSTPQNNFRVFLNGSIIFGGLGGGTNKTSIVIGKAFESALKEVIQADDGLRTRSFIELVAETVYNSQVLDQLLEVQKLDNFDIEGAIHAYYNIISQPCMVCREFDEARVPHGYASLHSIPLSESLKIVKDYLIAATAKDCSLMISFKPRDDGDFGSPYGHIHIKSTNQNFDYKVNFIDLDLKPLKKMETYYEKDKKILNAYAQMGETKHMKGNTSMEVYETIK
ncbi:inositol-pentakisphosphate 2-kinase isoform X1 [Manihot esculenta]|uniref:Inositol-pentakisphosphate 2-kinase n=1 Tax=Manihot esculenta TaxID=3983 RepID=A0A2C9VZ23_MANES|nr:inositol-pentakisphosphate 2-kinase isoform X1 [Manihot esculenta]XP_021613504.1 inositol-pentakisphosphate 2-kinase isoform X1 [Manihot esculenta]XP_021613505.1 inositol-pentakisphosphate 2-kinase isoform X1 [Manihot esculenta]XP_043812858.1 inositol-pentakisphosphate 2-kinase isoform X1 [Manihot esculenta]XP_043812859.1 inositol-pentakisphosphate 2-kinase isoform X1 [Manihot esculenta]